MEAILPSPIMCVLIAVIVIILAEIMWCMDSAATLRCSGYGLESLLTGHLDKVVYTGGRVLVYECAG